MSNAAAFIVIREGQHKIYFNKWSAESCILDLEGGPESAAAAMTANNEESHDFPFSEAGYLIDFDKKLLVFYSDYLDSVLEDLELGEFDDGDCPKRSMLLSPIFRHNGPDGRSRTTTKTIRRSILI